MIDIDSIDDYEIPKMIRELFLDPFDPDAREEDILAHSAARRIEELQNYSDYLYADWERERRWNRNG